MVRWEARPHRKADDEAEEEVETEKSEKVGLEIWVLRGLRPEKYAAASDALDGAKAKVFRH